MSFGIKKTGARSRLCAGNSSIKRLISCWLTVIAEQFKTEFSEESGAGGVEMFSTGVRNDYESIYISNTEAVLRKKF